MRDFIFIAILVSMAGLAAWDAWTGSWTSLSIDLAVAWFAFRAWNPRKRRRR